ncbi:MAG: F0F1 ATP synthase subunit epsilon [Paracoccaceae bacterium]
MAETMQFDLVSPERQLASLAADAVEIPGAEGDLTAMAEHAPFLTTLRPGLVRVHVGNAVTEYVVTGGFAELSSAGASILAEVAVPKAEFGADMLAGLISDAETAAANAAEENKAATALRVNDLKTLGSQLGL